MPSAKQFQVDVDPEIARIFGDAPVGGRLPSNLQWAPDSSLVAFQRKVKTEKDGAYKELWVHSPKTGKEWPIKKGPDFTVSSYDWCGSNRFVLLSQGDIFTVDLEGKTTQLTETEADESAVRCSDDGEKVGFVRDHNIFAISIADRSERQVTTHGTLEKTLGEVTWVYGEEFRVDDGFGWSPDGERIWFYEMDAANAPRRTVVASPEGETIEQFYPRAGEANPVVRIGVAHLRKKEVTSTWLGTGEETDVYLPQVMFTPDSKSLIVARFDRLQTILDLMRCDTKSNECEVIVTERDPRWVNLPPLPEITRGGKEFLWLSERDGFRHIYRFDMEGRELGQLTRGKWVVSSIDGVDEKNGKIYFRANIERPTDYGIFALDMKRIKIKEVSVLPGVHQASFSPNYAYFVDTHSALDRPPRRDIFKTDGELQSTVAEQDLRPYAIPNVMTDFLTIKTPDGETLNARLTRPMALATDKKYPVLVYVYGGPGAQVVKNQFRTKYNPWMFLLASRGVLVFSVDGRGSGGRGREFEAAVHRRLGELELEDQLAGVAYLKTLPFVDPKRVGVYGWSYGGTMVLSALLRTKGVFKAGVAVAPVTDWRQYDSAYTERYMQRPGDNEEGYADTSLLTEAKHLSAPLLLMHGLADDNVHFTNSALIIGELVKEKKQFELMVYPGRDHGMRGGEDILGHVFSTLTHFLERHL